VAATRDGWFGWEGRPLLLYSGGRIRLGRGSVHLARATTRFGEGKITASNSNRKRRALGRWCQPIGADSDSDYTSSFTSCGSLSSTHRRDEWKHPTVAC
jgi:hypothetical protein